MAKRHPIEYAKVLLGLTKDKSGKELDEAIAAFVNYLDFEKAVNKAPYIIEAFERLAKEEEGIVSLEITTAREVSAGMIKKVEDAFGKQVESTVSVDEGLVGGVVVKKGNTILDGSIKTQVQKLQSALS